jgi:multidrug resistance efflux pump
MKINLLYLLIPAAAFGCYWIMTDLQGQSVHTFFGTAETEPQTLNFEHDVMVQDVKVLTGDYIKKGDTLATLYRSVLDKTTVERLGNINQIEVERSTKIENLNKDRAVLLAQKEARLSELRAQIHILQIEDSIKSSVKKTIYDNIPQDNQLLKEKITAIQSEIIQTEKQTQEKIYQLEAQLQANQAITQARVAQLKSDLNFIELEKNKLVLIAPFDGYMEQVFVVKNSLVPAYKDLFKINAKKPNKIIGFIHETTDIPFQLGDTVSLVSSVRQLIQAKGVIIGSNPKLVELPYRLRKFTELRAWGREVFIQMPDTNQFYIGEKIVVTLKHTPPQLK